MKKIKLSGLEYKEEERSIRIAKIINKEKEESYRINTSRTLKDGRKVDQVLHMSKETMELIFFAVEKVEKDTKCHNYLK